MSIFPLHLFSIILTKILYNKKGSVPFAMNKCFLLNPEKNLSKMVFESLKLTFKLLTV